VRKTIGPRGLFTGEALQAALVNEISDRSEGVLRSIKRMIRNAACRVNDTARLAPAEGRLWILAWRGADASHYTDTVEMQVAALSTVRRLQAVHGQGAGMLGGLPRLP